MATYGSIRYSGVADAGVITGTDSYTNTADLPTVGVDTGAMAYVSATNKLYMWNGSAWFNIAIVNQAPTAITGNQASYALAIDGTPTTVTLVSTDPEGFPLTWSATTSGDTQVGTVTNTDNVFTITPSTDEADIGTLSVTFSVTDGNNTETSVSSFTLAFLSPLWDETVLSIGTSTTNSLNNSTFIDRSTNAHTVTATGTPTQTVFHPYLDNWSVEFEGYRERIDYGNDSTTDFALGTNDFCTEIKFYLKPGMTTPYYNRLLGIGSHYGNSTAFGIILEDEDNSDKITVYWDDGSLARKLISTTSVEYGRWNHIAVVRSGSNHALFYNGSRIATYTSSSSIGATKSAYVGWSAEPHDSGFLGYFTDFRIVVGSSVYDPTQTSITVPTQKLTAITNTKLLAGVQNNFKDTVNPDRVLTLTNGPKVSAFNPFRQDSEYAVGENKGSCLVTGSSHVYATDDADFTLGTSDFTAELWLYKYGTSSRQYDDAAIIGTADPTDKYGFHIMDWQDKLRFLIGNGSWVVNQDIDEPMPYHEWIHLCLVRNGNDFTLYKNGVSIYSVTNSIDLTATNNRLSIGGRGYLNQSVAGYISDVRFTRSALYTTDFTPPTAPVGNTNASLYLPFDNAGIFDKTGNNTLTLVGDVSTSTTQTKFADTAMYFDGTGDYIISDTANHLGDKDFTFETWWYPTSTIRQGIFHGSWGNDYSIGMDYSSTSSNQKIGIWAGSNGSSWNLINSDAGGNGIGSETINQNAWNHIAYTREGTTWRLFVNGVLDVELTGISGSIAYPTQPIVIGNWFANIQSVKVINGYIENLQILNGVAKYTTNFTPPNRTQGITYQAES